MNTGSRRARQLGHGRPHLIDRVRARDSLLPSIRRYNEIESGLDGHPHVRSNIHVHVSFARRARRDLLRVSPWGLRKQWLGDERYGGLCAGGGYRPIG